jgi:hypothetical protein
VNMEVVGCVASGDTTHNLHIHLFLIGRVIRGSDRYSTQAF